MKERNPRIWPTLTTNKRDDKHRFEWCRHYNICLSEASEKQWPSFTCWYCPYNPLAKKKKGEKPWQLQPTDVQLVDKI